MQWQDSLGYNERNYSMKELSVDVKTYADKKTQDNLRVVFIHTLKNQLELVKLEETCVIPYSVMSGKIMLECKSSYEEIQAQAAVQNAVKTINLFGPENGDFENNTLAEKNNLERLFADKKLDSKEKTYLQAIKRLIQSKLYPPRSLQEELVKRAEGYDLTKLSFEDVMSRKTIITDNWLWTRIVQSKPGNPLKECVKKLAAKLSELCIDRVEDLTVLTQRLSIKVNYIGTAELHRLPTKDEFDNMKNIRNVYVEYEELYPNQLDKYLTCLCATLMTRNLNYVNTIYNILNDTNCTIPYEYRLPDLTELQNVSASNVSYAIIENKWTDYIMRHLDTIEKLVDLITGALEYLVPKWKANIDGVTYIDGYDGLQVYYESIGYDLDTIDALLSIEPQVMDMSQMLKDIIKANSHSDFDKMAYDIATKALNNLKRTGNHNLSSKQLGILDKRYASIKKTWELEKTVDKNECVLIARELKTKYGPRMNGVVKNIVEYTLNYQICSQKQLEVMRLALVQLDNEAKKPVEQKKPEVNKDGLIFNIPGMKDPIDSEQLVAQTKENLALDPYKDAFDGSSSSSKSESTDSIWDD